MLNLFNTYEFTFAGESSLAYNLFICDLDSKSNEDTAFGNEASIIETRTTGRVQPIHQGVNYHEKPLEFNLVFGSETPLDRYDFQEVQLWLTGYQEYQWLSICQPDMEDYQYRCLITNLEPISVGWLPFAFEATITCDCPYAYGFPFTETYEVAGETEIVFRNNSSVREYIKPVLTIEPTAADFSIVNADDNGREFKLTGVPAADSIITVDNNAGIITESHGTNLYDKFNMNFFRLVRGDNHLKITDSGKLTISGRMLYNVDA